MSGVRGLCEELGIDQADELFLMAAEFNPGKRHRDALEALAKTGRRDFHLALAGKGPLEDAMKDLAEKLGISRQVHFLGQRSDIPLLMLASRATILPSEREGAEPQCDGIPRLRHPRSGRGRAGNPRSRH